MAVAAALNTAAVALFVVPVETTALFEPHDQDVITAEEEMLPARRIVSQRLSSVIVLVGTNLCAGFAPPDTSSLSYLKPLS